MERQSLAVQTRAVLGKKVKKLRRDGFLPGNIFGKNVSSSAVQVSLPDFSAVYDKAGETGLVDLKLGDETRTVLIKNVQLHSVSRLPLHADFHQVNLKEKTTAVIPIELAGESPAVVEKIGLLIQTLNEIEVEALPTELPERLTVEVSGLAEIGQELTVADLKGYDKAKVELLAELSEVVVKVVPAVVEEKEEVKPAEEAAAEGEVPVEGQALTEGETEEGEKKGG